MTVKQFEILEMIAKGGMAEVFRAKTSGVQGFEKEVCVKKILPHLTEDDSFVEMFVNEAKLAATLSYANIVHVHDLCRSAAGEFFIVMEYVHGKDLSDVIRAAQLAGREVPVDLAIHVGREMLKGLYYAHNKTDPEGAPLNIIHRDISPHNVLVSFMGEVKLTDFGIAKASSIMNKTAVGILKGKYGYMSPEQARGQPLDHRSDIFNTGIVLYELLVGERCFAGSSDFSTLNLMRNAEVTPPTKINAKLPKEMEAIILKALSKDKKDRFQDGVEFEKALATYAKQSGQHATATELGEFMRSLFANGLEKKPNIPTGILNLASVADPNAIPAAAPVAKAERAEKADKKGKPTVDVKAPAEAAPAATKAVPRPELAKAEAPKPAEAPKEEPKKEKKPAKIKADKDAGGDEAPKKKGQSDGPKRPVGRKDLRPGLTRIQQMQSNVQPRTMLKAVGILSIALVAGLGIGWFRAGQIGRQSAFRDLEKGATSGKKLVTLFLETDPPGASVRFDGIELSSRTPLTIERDRDGDLHTMVITKDGFKSASRSLKYGPGALTYFKERLEGDPGKLEVETEPEGLSVKIDGEDAGKTPLFKPVAAGRHAVEIGGGDRSTLKLEVDVAVGKTTTVHRVVPDKDSTASLSLRSTPRARVYIDGKATPHYTNGPEITLPPGVEHTIGLRLDPRKDRQQLTINLKKGERRALYFDLGDS